MLAFFVLIILAVISGAFMEIAGETASGSKKYISPAAVSRLLALVFGATALCVARYL